MSRIVSARRLIAGLCGASALTLGMMGAAYAAGTQVTVGGSASPEGPVAVEGVNNGSFGFDTNYNAPLNCDTASVDGNVIRGADVTEGNKVGEITNLLFEDCTATDLNLPVVVEMSAGDFIVSDDSGGAGDPVPVSIEGVHAYIHSTGSPTYACEFDADGSVDATIIPGSGNVDGQVELKPVTVGDDSTYKLVIQAKDGNGNDATSSCGGEIVTGDLAGPTSGLFDLDTLGEGLINHS